MVGRGGRSKGCDSCRQRHLKCDQTAPRCQRCQKDGFKCQYPAPKFINVFQKSSPPASDEARQNRSRTLTPPMPSPGSDEQSFTVSHLRNTVFATDPNDIAWPGFDALMHEDDRLSFRCLKALSESYFGTTCNAPQIRRRGQREYGACLQIVHNRLSKPKVDVSRDTILAITILGGYELLFFTKPSGWADHVLGVAKLFEMAGPDICADETCFSIFTDMRYIIGLAAFSRGETTFLALPEWRTTPWEKYGRPKSEEDLLSDILVEIPALGCLQRAEALKSDEELDATSDPENRTYAVALNMLTRLNDWRQIWQANSAPMTCPAMPRTEFDDELPKPWVTEYQFVSLDAANSFEVYNSMVILLVQMILAAARPGDLNAGDEGVLSNMARTSALDICRSVDYNIFYCSGKLGQLTILVPMEKAYEWLGKNSSPEGRWLERRHSHLLRITGSWQVAQAAFSEPKDSREVPYVASRTSPSTSPNSNSVDGSASVASL